jgi:chromosome partitioning protein
MAFANNKGGVSKTTSAFAIGLLLAAEKGKRVLFVDVDDQANLTQGALGANRSATPNISDYFAQPATLAQCIHPTRFDNLWIIPSHRDLRLTMTNANNWIDVEQQFIADLHHASVKVPDGEDFDWIIIDTPPTISLHTRAALLAAHYVIAPFTPSPLDGQGLLNLLDSLADISNIVGAGEQTQILGCFTTRWKRAAVARQDTETLKAQISKKGVALFGTDIADDPLSVRKLFIPDPLPDIRKLHGAIDDYRELVKEIQTNVSDN